MLERIRDGLQGPWAIAIVALIVVSFVFTGVGGYLNSNTSSAVAVVNDEEISQNSLDIALQNERAQLESRFGEAIGNLFANESYLADFRKGILDRLVNDTLLAQKAKELGLRMSDEQIKDAIVQMPQFQLAGQFSNEAYQNSIQRAGFTPGEFAEYMRVQLTREQLRQALTGSTINVDKAVEDILKLQKQARDASFIEVSAASYVDDVEVSDEEIKQYYESNISQYDTQERVKLAFISLSVDNLMPRVEVSEDDLQNYYQENLSYYQTQEVREVAHILFETSEGEDQAREEAQATLERITNGEDFAALAAEVSDDLVSAEDGGYLGAVEIGDFEESFTDAAFGLQNEGEVSQIVQTEFGFHIIKLTSLKKVETTPFEDVREEILTEVKRDKATGNFYELQAEMERIAFESAESLDEIATLIDRPVLETNLFSENAYPASVNYPQVQNVAFSDELIQDRVNSELLSLSDSEVMIVRVVEHEPQRTKSLDEVESEIRTVLTNEKAQQAAYAWAQELQNALFEGKDESEFLSQKALAWNSFSALSRNNTELPRDVTSALFGLSTLSGNNSAVINLQNGNVGVVRLDKIIPVEELTEEELESFRNRYASQQAQRTFDNFIEALKSEAEITFIQ